MEKAEKTKFHLLNQDRRKTMKLVAIDYKKHE